MLNLDEMQAGGPERSAELEAICRDLYARLRPQETPPGFRVEFRRFAGLNHFIRRRDGAIHLLVSDILAGAPLKVLESVVGILLCKLLREPVPAECRRRYREYVSRDDVQRALHTTRAARGRKRMGPPRGRCYDLEELFDRLNSRYFGGALAKPRLGWSVRASRRRLGHYDAAHRTIVISRILDDPRAPEFAVEYVLYHEMLHAVHPARRSGTRREVHTKEFQEAERRFPRLAEARAWLKRL